MNRCLAPAASRRSLFTETDASGLRRLTYSDVPSQEVFSKEWQSYRTVASNCSSQRVRQLKWSFFNRLPLPV